MKALILAGGKGTRLQPLTTVVNKHLLLVYDKPLIMHVIETLKEAGITDITISLSHHHPGQFMGLLDDGSELGVKLTYVIHGEPKGISYGIYHAKHVLGKEPFLCVLGDNLFAAGLKDQVKTFLQEPGRPMVLLKKVATLEEAKAYGVAEFMAKEPSLLEEYKPPLRRVVEKPENPPSHYIMIGAYFLTSHFFEIYPTLKPSARGEYEITDAINALGGYHVRYEIYPSSWLDCGTFEDLWKASNVMRLAKYGKNHS